MTERRALDDEAAARLLANVPLIRQAIVPAGVDPRPAAEGLGWPVVLKARAPGLHHRTDVGGVALGLEGPEDLAQAVARMEALATDGFLVQQQVSPGPELLAGFVRDPAWGPVVMLGAGGVRAEGDPDVVIRLWPASRDTLATMCSELRSHRLYEGFRGAPAVDPDALARVLEALGRAGAAHPEVAEIDLNPLIVTPTGPVAVDALVVTDTPAPRVDVPPLSERIASITPFFEARSIAVVGASRTRHKAGNVILRNLRRCGFSGAVYPVNPTVDEVEGLPCHPSVSAIGAPVDVVVSVTPREAVLSVAEDCAAAGVRCLIVSTAGFSDEGEAGRALEESLVRRCGELGIRLMGPNSIGTVNVETGLVTSLASIEPVPPGHTAFLGQTGLFSSAFPRWFSATGRQGAALFASIGNKGDVDESDLLDYLAANDDIRAVGAYLEGIRAGRSLYEAMARLSAKKPLVVVKSGRTALGARAAASHTGALASDDRVADAAFRQVGVVRVREVSELFDQVLGFETLPLPTGRRLGVVSITGVGCVLTADAAGEHGLELPDLQPETLMRIREAAPPWAPIRNPVDMWSTIERVGPAEAYRHLAQVVLADPGIDMLLLIAIHIPESALDPAETFGGLRAVAPSKPVVGSFFGYEPALEDYRSAMRTLGIPVFDDPTHAVRVLAGLADYAAWRRSGTVSP